MLKTLIDQLSNPAPAARIEALCALVMLEETEALPLLTQLWSAEQDPQVKQAIGWAGTQIHAAQQRGYTTIEAMAAAYRVHLAPDEKELEEERKLSQIQTNINIQQAKEYGTDAGGRAVGNALKGAAIAGALGAVGGLGTGAMLSAMSPSVSPSSALEESAKRPGIGKEHIVPSRPGAADISTWLKRLSAPDAKTRRTVLMQLRDFNNPLALGPLGSLFIKEPDPALRELAQQTGKQIYFSAIYWQDFDPNKAHEKAKQIQASADAAKQKRATQQ